MVCFHYLKCNTASCCPEHIKMRGEIQINSATAFITVNITMSLKWQELELGVNSKLEAAQVFKTEHQVKQKSC